MFYLIRLYQEFHFFDWQVVSHSVRWYLDMFLKLDAQSYRWSPALHWWFFTRGECAGQGVRAVAAVSSGINVGLMLSGFKICMCIYIYTSKTKLCPLVVVNPSHGSSWRPVLFGFGLSGYVYIHICIYTIWLRLPMNDWLLGCFFGESPDSYTPLFQVVELLYLTQTWWVMGSKLLTAIPDGWKCKHRPNFGGSFGFLAQAFVEKAAPCFSKWWFQRCLIFIWKMT